MTTPSAKADGFLGHARSDLPRFVPNAQSERTGKDITGGVDIAVNDQSAVRTRVNTVRESFSNVRQAPATGAHLRSPVGINRDKPPTGLFHFVGEFGEERTPSRIANRLRQDTSGKGTNIKVFNGNESVTTNKTAAQLVLKVRPLVTDVSMRLLAFSSRRVLRRDSISPISTGRLYFGQQTRSYFSEYTAPAFLAYSVRVMLTLYNKPLFTKRKEERRFLCQLKQAVPSAHES